ncbi:hypothetical protein IAU59_002396 [Kwoniella sp. CBS 9459]
MSASGADRGSRAEGRLDSRHKRKRGGHHSRGKGRKTRTGKRYARVADVEAAEEFETLPEDEDEEGGHAEADTEAERELEGVREKSTRGVSIDIQETDVGDTEIHPGRSNEVLVQRRSTPNNASIGGGGRSASGRGSVEPR